MKKENIIKIGIMSKEQYKKRTIAIAKGEYVPMQDEPKVWFESLQSMSQILSSQNQELLKVIIEK
jgi:predicted transcriptional regulator